MNIHIGSLRDLISHLIGTKNEANLEKKTLPAPLVDSLISVGVNAEVSNLINHNLAWAAHNISQGLDKVGGEFIPRAAVDSLVANTLHQVHITIGAIGEQTNPT